MEMVCPEGYTLIKEGLTDICIPNPDLYKRSDNVFEPAWAPIFFNPTMLENRDISVAFFDSFVEEFQKRVIAVDAFAGTGVRGVRFAKEVLKRKGIEGIVVLNDISAEAVRIVGINASLNDVESIVRIFRLDANEALFKISRKIAPPHYIDIDPFGSPAPFVFSAVYTIRNGGVVALTATDLAVLEGKYGSKLFRRYGVKSRGKFSSKDIAIRNLISFVVRTASIFDKAAEPVLVHGGRHYVRVYVRIQSGANRANMVLNRCIGSIAVCPSCGFVAVGKSGQEIGSSCPKCGHPLSSFEDTWICSMVDPDIALKLTSRVTNIAWLSNSSKELLLKAISIHSSNLFPYRIALIARHLKANIPPLSKLIECVKASSYKAFRGYEHDEVYSNAPYDDLADCVKRLSMA